MISIGASEEKKKQLRTVTKIPVHKVYLITKNLTVENS